MKETPSSMCGMLLAFAALAAIPAVGADVDLQTRDSSKFDRKYEMDVLPTEQDLDGDGVADFTVVGDGDWLSVSGGIATFDMTGGNKYIGSLASAGNTGVWKKYAPTAETGYTIEVRMKIASQQQGKTFGLALSASEGSGCDSLLILKQENLNWKDNTITLAAFATTNAFHTYRLAKLPSEDRFVLWVDGGIVTNVLNDALTSTQNRLLLGAIGGTYGSVAEVDYLRFTKGAYAPKPLEMDSADFPRRYEMDSVDEGFSPTASTSAWTLGQGTAGTAALEDGVLSVVQQKPDQRYWLTSGPMDDSVARGSPFTLETRLKITGAWSAGGDVLHFRVGVPGASCAFFVNAGSISWRDSSSSETQRFECANDDGMHVLRVTYCVGRFTLWRDGGKLGEDLAISKTDDSNNNVRFGVVSGTAGGSFDIDYIRWTTDGAFAPVSPKKGLTVTVR